MFCWAIVVKAGGGSYCDLRLLKMQLFYGIHILLWELCNILVASRDFGFGVCICHSKTRRDRANMANKCQGFRIGLRATANCR